LIISGDRTATSVGGTGRAAEQPAAGEREVVVAAEEVLEVQGKLGPGRPGRVEAFVPVPAAAWGV
jgi:hypothetical protein